jgi:hypothetical protein
MGRTRKPGRAPGFDRAYPSQVLAWQNAPASADSACPLATHVRGRHVWQTCHGGWPTQTCGPAHAWPCPIERGASYQEGLAELKSSTGRDRGSDRHGTGQPVRADATIRLRDVTDDFQVYAAKPVTFRSSELMVHRLRLDKGRRVISLQRFACP